MGGPPLPFCPEVPGCCAGAPRNDSMTMTDPEHLELLAQHLTDREPLLTLSPAAVLAPVLLLLVIAAFAVIP